MVFLKVAVGMRKIATLTMEETVRRGATSATLSLMPKRHYILMDYNLIRK